MSEPSDRTERRVVNVELVVAVFALLTSACASIAAILQAREGLAQTRATVDEAHSVAVQLGASVWPYVSIEKQFTPASVTLSVIDQGLGPALIRNFRFSLHGDAPETQRELDAALDAKGGAHVEDVADFGSGSVLRPSEERRLVKIDYAPADMSAALRTFNAAHITVCYCSLLKECWTVGNATTDPQSVAACGPATRLDWLPR